MQALAARQTDHACAFAEKQGADGRHHDHHKSIGAKQTWRRHRANNLRVTSFVLLLKIDFLYHLFDEENVPEWTRYLAHYLEQGHENL